jgi:tyrosyl-tRNA synthetase
VSVSRTEPTLDLLDDLRWRGLIADVTKETELRAHLAEGRRTAYVGFDPTADSLHVGSLLPLLVLRRVQRAGHRPIVLIGGGTGLIGDPSGKLGERALNPGAQVAEWAGRLREQVERFLDFSGAAALLVDNYDWLRELSVIPFLRDVGKHFSLGSMLAKESVRSRMGRSEEGISYTEFSYQALQAYDFMALLERHDCTIQLGGTDQWGNITAGIELIRRVTGRGAYGLTMPLVTKADGSKFGKTETDTVWLDERKTSPYEMYQFWLNTTDEDAVPFLKQFTFLDRREIGELQAATASSPEKREAQRVLAHDVTALVHGEAKAREAEEISRAFFEGRVESLTEHQLTQACRAMPTTELQGHELAGLSMVDLLTRVGLAESKKRARELVADGAIYLNGQKIGPADVSLSRDQSLFGRFLVIRRGRRTYHAATLG